jgi:hypothetical protein
VGSLVHDPALWGTTLRIVAGLLVFGALAVSATPRTLKLCAQVAVLLIVVSLVLLLVV